MSGSTDKMMLGGDPPVEVQLRRSARARRLSLRVSGLDGRVTLSMPRDLPERQARAFLDDKADWVRAHVGESKDLRVPKIGDTVPVEGRELPVVIAAGRPAISAVAVHVRKGRPVPAQVAALLKLRARDRLTERCDAHAAQLGRRFGRITLRDTRSRWGSCTSAGNLMFSWRLIMAPPEILDYVAAHEVAHLVHMNHSAAFWDVVARLYPDYRAKRGWLRENGASLHRVRFDA